MKILVTGASGFIGGRFARHALEQGLQVLATGRRAEALEHLQRRGAQCLAADLSDPRQALVLCEDVEAVVHCAGAVGGWGRDDYFRQGNLQLTENIIEACLKRQVRRLVYLSSAAIYTDGQDHHALTEQQVPRHFRSPVARSRFLAEQRLFGAQEFGLQVLALRPSLVMGAGDASFLPRLLERQRSNRLAIIGNGLNRVDFTSVQNLADVLHSALHVGDSALGKAYNISNGAPIPLWDAVNYVLRQLQLAPLRRHVPVGVARSWGLLSEGVCSLLPGRPEPKLSRFQVDLLSRSFSLDISQARQHLDYQAKTPLWPALDEFCRWWRAQV